MISFKIKKFGLILFNFDSNLVSDTAPVTRCSFSSQNSKSGSNPEAL